MSPEVTAEVDIRCPAWHDGVEDADGTCARAASAAAGVAGRPVGRSEVSVVLCDDDFMADLNARYRERDGATNVLAFPLDETACPAAEPLLLGDIVVSYGTVAREAAAAGRPMDDHLSHMVVHGMLHLLGFDHITDADADEMEKLEALALARLGLPDPYAGEGDSSVAPRSHNDDR